MPKRNDLASDEKVKLLVDAVEDRKAVDPVLIDLRDKTLMTDFFLICSGTSDVHIRAIADSVLEKGELENLNRPRVEGQSVGEWVLIDFGDVVVHVMAQEPRERYKLEYFWTTPQPKGALPPTPDSVAAAALGPGSGDEDWDEEDENDEDDDASFFDDADQEVPPVDEDEDIAEDDESKTRAPHRSNGAAA